MACCPADSRSSERKALLASVVLGLWLCLALPVFSQEAYYWSYAQHPALSYYDHPPMTAWLIWLGTHAFGDGALGIRAGTLVCALVVTLAGLSLLRRFGADERARLAWIVLGFGVPMYAALHFLANPDPPLSAFWALAMLSLWRARDGGLGWWLLAGLAAGLGLVSKYSAAFLAIGGAVLLWIDPQLRRQLPRPAPWIGVGVAAVAFLPVVTWNLGNDFESFRFQTGDRFAVAGFGLRWFCQCVGGQFGVVNPGIVVLLPFALTWLWRRARLGDMRARWLLAFGVPMPLFWIGLSLFIHVKVNWFQPAYLPLLLGVVLWWTEGNGATARPRLCRFARASVIAAVAIVPIAPLVRLWPQRHGSTWSGWQTIAAAALRHGRTVDAEDDRTGNVFYFAASYKDAAQLQRALTILGDGTLPAPVLAQNVTGERALQFDHWHSPSAHLGEHAIFVLPRPAERAQEIADCSAHFASVERVQLVRVVTLGIEVLEAAVFVCHDYRGPDRK
ncbi:MAG: glycosyltransferase family 39 protein [Planctomycetes bacterium]|nr:glycosyltransferase family 39 protein [Planctomycetota bacterium]